ncbi:MAG TPA: DUF2934 domain-containing protein [Syntrophales bacterium]|nr:DUF2934 domain-containing protein [Syntrophales bacterium]
MNQNLHDEITQAAFELYQKEGCPEGRSLFHWLEAEKIVKERNEPKPKKTEVPKKPTGMKATKTLLPDLYNILVQMR